MKILHSLFSNGIGGTERHLADLANAQIRAGHEVTVMLRADRNPYNGVDTLREWLDAKVQIVAAPRRWPLVPLYFMLRCLRPDVIHTHHRRDSRYLALVKPCGVPAVATLHMPFRAQDYTRHDGLICVAPWQRAEIPTTKKRKVEVIPNWVSAPPKVSEAQRHALRAQMGVTDDHTKIIGVVGRLTEEKGNEDLVDAFLQLRPEGVKLCIFGEGECRPAIEQKIKAAQAEDKIILMGYEPKIRPFYAAFDGFILPSRYETFGLVLLEAMMAKLPILSTRTRGAKDVLGSDPQVIWAEANNLAAALQNLLPLLGQKCEYPALAEYQPERAFARVEEFYRELR